MIRTDVVVCDGTLNMKLIDSRFDGRNDRNGGGQHRNQGNQGSSYHRGGDSYNNHWSNSNSSGGYGDHRVDHRGDHRGGPSRDPRSSGYGRQDDRSVLLHTTT